MKILYLDLNYDDLIEDYSLTPSRYGGGRAVPANLLPYLNDNGHYMEIWANPACFDNVDSKYKQFCKGKSLEERQTASQNGISNFDIVLHNFHGTKVHVNDGYDLVWLVGFGEHVNVENQRIILYNNYQNPQIYNPFTKVYYARIGVPIPEFQEYPKQNFIFSCHRQSLNFGSKTMFEWAKKYQIRYFAGGPRDADFPDIDAYVDENYTNYLGLLSSGQKEHLFKGARCSTYIHNWNTPMNLSAIESLSYGTPIISTGVGFWPSLVKEGVNGFIIKDEEELLRAYENCKNLSQRDCYDSALEYSSDKMIRDYMKVFEKVLNKQ